MRSSQPWQGRQAAPTAAIRAWFWASILVGIAIVVRRVIALRGSSSAGTPPQLARLDFWFQSHAALTFTHILLALGLVLVLPLLFWNRTRTLTALRYVFYALGFAVGLTAYAMSSYSVGGWVERSAVLLFNSYFLVALVVSYRAWRIHSIRIEQQWTLRAVAVLLGIATTRPVMGVFFATSRLTHWTPEHFFGPAFWMGFSINVIAMECGYGSTPTSRRRDHGSNCRRHAQRPAYGCTRSTLHALVLDRALSRDSHVQVAVLAGAMGIRFDHRGLFPKLWDTRAVLHRLPTRRAHLPGLFGVTVISRLRLLGAKAAGTYIALLGILLVLADVFAGTMAMWTLIHPGVVEHPPTLLALYYLSYALGGPGFSVPMGLFLAGVSVTAGFMRLLPKWMVVYGLLLAAAGEVSLLHLVFPKLLFLIPLVRFPGFIWLIIAGFLFQRHRARSC